VTEGPAAGRSGLYGRRKGKPLSARREGLIAELLPALRLDVREPSPAALEQLFPVPVTGVRLEIGFGGAEHLLHEAAAHPKLGFIGVEPFVNGMAKALAGIAERGLRNIRLFEGDAAAVLAWLPEASLARVDLLYPDPWPKKRHWKRRFVSPANLDAIARALVPRGTFRFASDIPSYVEWTLIHLCRRADFVWTAQRPEDWREPWSGWPGTRYEAKALREGRTPNYLVFRRI
jgi:tRNA (guanine-N7-)-methyltransferase